MNYKIIKHIILTGSLPAPFLYLLITFQNALSPYIRYTAYSIFVVSVLYFFRIKANELADIYIEQQSIDQQLQVSTVDVQHNEVRTRRLSAIIASEKIDEFYHVEQLSSSIACYSPSIPQYAPSDKYSLAYLCCFRLNERFSDSASPVCWLLGFASFLVVLAIVLPLGYLVYLEIGILITIHSAGGWIISWGSWISLRSWWNWLSPTAFWSWLNSESVLEQPSYINLHYVLMLVFVICLIIGCIHLCCYIMNIPSTYWPANSKCSCFNRKDNSVTSSSSKLDSGSDSDDDIITKSINTAELANMIKQRPTIVIIYGAPDSGKSTAVKSLFYHLQNFFQFGITITGSDETGDYDYLGQNNVWDGYDEERFESYIKGIKMKHGESIKAGGKGNPPNFVFLDDLTGLVAKYSKFFINWCTTFRKPNTWVFITAHSLAQSLPTYLRTYNNFALIFGPSVGDKETKEIFGYWGSLFNNVKDFKAKYAMVTRTKHTCLVYMKEVDTKNIENCYKSFKADQIMSYNFQYATRCIDQPVEGIPNVVGNERKRNGKVRVERKSTELKEYGDRSDSD